MWSFSVDRTKCVHCGRCVAECSRLCLMMTREGPEPLPEAANRCFHCQHCLCVCPTGAITVEGVSPQQCPPAAPIPDSAAMLNLIRARRSCRIYKEENLPKDTLHKLRAMLPYSPTGVNARTLKFIIVSEKHKMDEIRRYSAGKLLEQIAARPEDPELAYFARFKTPLSNGINPIFRNAPHMIAVALPESTPCLTMDPIIALSYFELYAQTLGVGTLWCGMAYWLHRLMPEIMLNLGMPADYKLGYVMLFGPPAWNFARGAVRH
ncbi:MAG: nitroreductase family protein [Victivallaceae bacterium]|nr:nitroreductase family protein [Victivallaceae bacterium]